MKNSNNKPVMYALVFDNDKVQTKYFNSRQSLETYAEALTIEEKKYLGWGVCCACFFDSTGEMFINSTTGYNVFTTQN